MRQGNICKRVDDVVRPMKALDRARDSRRGNFPPCKILDDIQLFPEDVGATLNSLVEVLAHEWEVAYSLFVEVLHDDGQYLAHDGRLIHRGARASSDCRGVQIRIVLIAFGVYKM